MNRVPMSALREIAAGRARLLPPAARNSHWRQVIADLKRQLENLDLEGDIESLLVYAPGRKAVNCYGIELDGGIVHRKLNLPIATAVRYPRRSDITSWQRGYFVPGTEFRLDSGLWVAIINVPLAPEDWPTTAIPFPRQPLK